MKLVSLILSMSLPIFGAFAYEKDAIIEDSKFIKAISLATNKQWEDAAYYAKEATDYKYALTAIKALKIYYAPVSYKLEEIKQFFSDSPWLPIEMYVPIIEKSLSFENKPEEIIHWFEYKEPTSNYGKFLLLHANLQLKNISFEDAEIQKTFRYYWRYTALDLAAERYFINNYKAYLTLNDLLKKIEFLTWNKSFDQAAILIQLLPQEFQEVPSKRLKTARNPESVKHILIRASEKLKKDEFIKFTLIEQMLKKQEDQKALFTLLRTKPTSQFERWWRLKHIAIRNALSEKNYRVAYQLTQDHKLETPANFTEAEWIAGWIALRFLKDKKTAKKHFESMYNIAKLANTKSKAAYWLAQSVEQLGDNKEALRWYEIAGEFKGTFYGHLGLARLHGSKKLSYYTDSDDKYDQERIDNVTKLCMLIHVLYKTQNKKLATEMINYFPTELMSNHELKHAASYFNKEKLYPLAVELSKMAANKSAILIDEGYPQHIPIFGNNLPKSLYYAIIRQESKFDQEAISVAGAKGLMQIMPSTASKLASILGLPKNAYATNASANIKKGVLYVDQLYDQFKNCVLTVAAYNAGPGNVKKWIDKFGDPRSFKSYQEVLDWIELIPFAETRNYVKKVLENFVIYDSYFSPKHTARTVVSFLLY